MSTTAELDENKLEEFQHAVLGEIGATLNAALVRIGDRQGLYREMAGGEPVQAADLAERTGTRERYVREWLAAQAAGGYLEYDPESETYRLPPEQAAVLADEESPYFMLGGFEVASACFADEPRIAEAFQSGDGFGWHEHDHRLFEGTERLFRPNYRANLIDSWIPALDGVKEKLEAGAVVADVGCGHGASTILMAAAFPRSTFIGFDYHDGSIAAAESAAEAAGVAGQATFTVGSGTDFEAGSDQFDLICFFDCLHDLGDPVGTCRHAGEVIKPDGSMMIVEPHAGATVEENQNPVGRMFYCASTLLCVPNSLDQDVGLALGAQAGQDRIGAVVAEAGFSRFRCAAETPLNLVFEARP